MASLQDALWISRNAAPLKNSQALISMEVLETPFCCLWLLSCMHSFVFFQGLHTWLALADLQWAFDVADISSMLICAHEAGVGGADWMVLYDILHVDHQRVFHLGLLSSIFLLLLNDCVPCSRSTRVSRKTACSPNSVYVKMSGRPMGARTPSFSLPDRPRNRKMSDNPVRFSTLIRVSW